MPAVAPRRTLSPPVNPLEEVYRSHADRVLRTAYRITGNLPDAEDALQTVFLRLARREGPRLPEEEIGPYLCRAAVHAALDIVRDRGARAASAPLDARAERIPSPAPGPEDDRAEADLRARLRAALASLSPLAAEIFALRCFEGYGNREIARMTGRSALVVGVLLHRARARLRDILLSPHGEKP